MSLALILSLLSIGIIASISELSLDEPETEDGSDTDPSTEVDEIGSVLSLFDDSDDIENSPGVEMITDEGVGGIVGTNNADEISTNDFGGGHFTNFVDAKAGNDTILANGHRLNISGGAGDDLIISNGANESEVYGGHGADHIGLEFGFGNELHGDDGDDTITLAGGPFAENNEAYGGAGDDTLNIFGGITEFSSSNTLVSGGEGADSFSIFTSNAYWQDSGPNEDHTTNIVATLADFDTNEDTLSITVINDEFFQFQEMQILEREEQEDGVTRRYTDIVLCSENSEDGIREAIITLDGISGLTEESINLEIREAPSSFF